MVPGSIRRLGSGESLRYLHRSGIDQDVSQSLHTGVIDRARPNSRADQGCRRRAQGGSYKARRAYRCHVAAYHAAVDRGELALPLRHTGRRARIRAGNKVLRTSRQGQRGERDLFCRVVGRLPRDHKRCLTGLCCSLPYIIQPWGYPGAGGAGQFGVCRNDASAHFALTTASDRLLRPGDHFAKSLGNYHFFASRPARCVPPRVPVLCSPHATIWQQKKGH